MIDNSVWRIEWLDFLSRYKMLSARTWPNFNKSTSSMEEACRHVLEDALKTTTEQATAEGKQVVLYAVGKKSKVFIKDHFTVERLEELRKNSREWVIVAMQKPARGFTHRK